MWCGNADKQSESLGDTPEEYRSCYLAVRLRVFSCRRHPRAPTCNQKFADCVEQQQVCRFHRMLLNDIAKMRVVRMMALGGQSLPDPIPRTIDMNQSSFLSRG